MSDTTSELTFAQSDLVAGLGVPSAYVDRQALLVNCNQPFAAAIGFTTPEAALGQSVLKWIAPERQHAFEELHRARRPGLLETALLTPEALDHSPTLALFPVDDGTLLQVAGVWRPRLSGDATFTQFVAGVAHEINNPLQYAIPAAKLALDDIERLGPHAGELEEHVTQMQVALERIRGVVDDLRSFRVATRSDASVSVNEVVVETVRLVRQSAAHVRLTWDLGVVPPARGEAGYLGQVLLNLLSNAVRVLPASRGPEHNRVTIRTWLAGGQVQIRVEDNGPGIPPDILDRVFDPFVTRREGGTGLGLTVCSNLIRAMGGEIGVRSSADHGTTFTIELPQASDDAAQRRPRRTERGGPLSRLVIIDDVPQVRRVIRRALRKPPPEIVEFESGNQAIAWLAEGKRVDRILCDRVMDDGDGDAVLSWLQEHRPDLMPRFVLMTGGFPPDSDTIETEILSKPFSMARLHQIPEWCFDPKNRDLGRAA